MSQRTLSDLSSLESLAAEDLSKVYKHFIHIVTKSQSSIVLGAKKYSVAHWLCAVWPLTCGVLNVLQKKMTKWKQLWGACPLCCWKRRRFD